MELVVVIGIMSLLLMFSFPVFRDIPLFSDTGAGTGDLVRLMDDLKKRAVEADTDFLLHLEPESGRVWVTHEGIDEAKMQSARENGAELSGDLRVIGVEYPEFKDPGGREYLIRFNRRGYSDFAYIHVTEDRKKRTLKLEPFLPRVLILEDHAHFEDCI